MSRKFAVEGDDALATGLQDGVFRSDSADRAGQAAATHWGSTVIVVSSLL
ncbi:hypothetical protein [Mycobacterium simiae]|nr:hypothetical protein [Mycobacterium simiae]